MDYFLKGFTDTCKKYKVPARLIIEAALKDVDSLENNDYNDIPNVGYKNPGNSTLLGKNLNVNNRSKFKPNNEIAFSDIRTHTRNN